MTATLKASLLPVEVIEAEQTVARCELTLIEAKEAAKAAREAYDTAVQGLRRAVRNSEPTIFDLDTGEVEEDGDVD